MIPISAYLPHGLQTCAEAFDWSRASEVSGCWIAKAQARDREAGRRGLIDFHQARWRVGDRGPLDKRISDLGELLQAIEVLQSGLDSRRVYPKTLSTANRRISPPGVDAVAVTIEDLTLEPLTDEEQLLLLEAKHSLSADPNVAVGALVADLRKTDERRVHDELQLLVSQLEADGHAYPERINKFLDAHSHFGLLVLFDPDVTLPDGLVEAGRRRLLGQAAAMGIPVNVLGFVAVEELEEWVRSTL